jgi:hypothetical protein
MRFILVKIGEVGFEEVDVFPWNIANQRRPEVQKLVSRERQ